MLANVIMWFGLDKSKFLTAQTECYGDGINYCADKDSGESNKIYNYSYAVRNNFSVICIENAVRADAIT